MASPSSRLPLRVAIVSDAAPERNGVGTYYRDLAAHLEPRVQALTLLCPGSGQPLPHWLEMPLPGDATQRLGLPSPRRLQQRLAAFAPDVIIVATPGPYGLLGARAARRLGARLLFGLHTHYEALTGLYWGRVLAPLNRWWLAGTNRRLFRQADAVITNAPGMHRLAQELGARRAHLLGTPLPRPFLERPPAALQSPPRSVLFVGRLAAEKRVHAVIEAAERLPGLQFRIAGDGPERPWVDAAAARLPNLEALGWLDRDAILDALDSSDLLVLPSVVEAFGTVALEALARGRITLAARGCGILDWPELARGLHRIGAGENVADALARVTALDPAVLAHKAGQGRAAVLACAESGITPWLDVLAGQAAGERRHA
ncbi:glycosyltransferase [Spiribacter halobius]|nr:glycosyltransferase [Spiribacter halobius]UEX78712.1 glycosyltransferase [Spiribacter halobius]